MTTHDPVACNGHQHRYATAVVLAAVCVACILGGVGVLEQQTPSVIVSGEWASVPVHALPTAGVLGLGLLACACALAGAVIILRRRR